MRIGTRITHPDEVGMWDVDILQITVYRDSRTALHLVESSAARCRELGIPFVVHPVGYSLIGGDADVVFSMAEASDLAVILHDERKKNGRRIEGADADVFRAAAERLSSVALVSFENAADSGDAPWFWQSFAESVTLDIGHVESSGLDANAYIERLDEETIGKIDFVHMHRNGALRGGITDHWFLEDGCREMSALKKLLGRTDDVSVILELNDVDRIDDNLELLRRLRHEMGLAP